MLSLSDQLHSRALEASTRYKRAEAELIEILQQVEEHQVFLKRGHSSIFSYVTRELGLGENIAYSLITVARKARDIPELKNQIQNGAITLSNARRVASVITSQNQAEWIQKAKELSHRQLEKEIVKVNPTQATVERASYVAGNRVKLELGLSEHEMLKLRRVQDLLSQNKKRAVSLEETIQTLTYEFLDRHDPVEKAKRHQVKKGSSTVVMQEPGKSEAEPKVIEEYAERKSIVVDLRLNGAPKKPEDMRPTFPVRKLVTLREVPKYKVSKRHPLSAAILHQVNLRDQRRCAHLDSSARRCNQSRWIEIHHKTPVSQGGRDTVENLITLCSAHHRYWHLKLMNTRDTSERISGEIG